MLHICIENEILMFLRKKSRRKTEVSFDEPLNVDYDGNELLRCRTSWAPRAISSRKASMRKKTNASR